MTALEFAIRKNGCVRIVDKLVANVNRPFMTNFTPLICAALEGDVAIVKTLLLAGAEVGTVTQGHRKTALTMAADEGQAYVVEFLLDVDGIDVDHATSDGNTALLYATKTTTAETVEKLLAAGANVHHVNVDGESTLIRAAKGGNVEIVELILRRVVAVDHSDAKGSTALLHASRRGHADVVEMLLGMGNAQIDHANHRCATALSRAIDNGHSHVEEILLAWGAKVEDGVKNGTFPCQDDHPTLTTTLVAAGADLFL